MLGKCTLNDIRSLLGIFNADSGFNNGVTGLRDVSLDGKAVIWLAQSNSRLL